MELIEKVLIKASAWKKKIYMTSALFSGDGMFGRYLSNYKFRY